MQRLVLIALTSMALIGIQENQVMAEDVSSPQKENSELWQKAQGLLENGDSFQLVELLTSGDDPVSAADLFSQYVHKLYMESKNIPQMVMCGRAGIQYSLDRAEQLQGSDPETADKLRGIAKTIAYNVSVNCWPGWGEAGIEITRSDLAVGLDLARLNLRLANELERDDFVHGNAYWLVGAQWLAQGKREPAVNAFEKSARHFREAGKPDYEEMARGYIGLANLLEEASQNTGEVQIKEAQQALLKIGSEDAKFFSEQLTTVRRIFAKQ